MKRITKFNTTLLWILLLTLGVANAQDRAYQPRFSTNDFGNITLVGNGLLTCDAGNTDCADIQAGTVSGGNNQQMAYINVDGGAGFSNSSSADMNLPLGSEVLFAGLYWAGRDDENEAARGVIQMREPGAATYTAVNASVIDTFATQGAAGSRPYQAFADVTARVKAAGNGTYFVGNLSAELGSDALGFFGGWGLIVAYSDTNQPFRRLMVFDGAARVTGTDSVPVTVTGLITPSTPGFDTFLGALVWEGDESITGDQFSFEGNTVSDGLNPNNNFWNSSNTREGVAYTDRNPAYVNQLAMDLDYIDVSGLLGPNETEADIVFVTDGDTYFPNVLTFATDLFVPDLVSSLSKTAVDINGDDVEPGDVIEYTIVFENTGADGATKTVLTDVIPAGTTYVPNSINVTTADVGPSGVQDDTVGSGPCGYNGSAVICGLGAGAVNGVGGTFLQNEGATFVFQVKIDANAPAGDITNTVDVLHNSQTFPADEFTGSADAVITVVALPALTVDKALTGHNDVDTSGDITEGDILEFTVTVTNTGNIPLNNLTASDAMITPSSNNCGTVAPLGTCVLVGTYTVTAADALAGSITNTGTGDSDEVGPETDVVVTDVEGTPALTVDKALTDHNDVDTSGDITEGDILEFTITVTNTGNIPLNNLTASDAMITPSSNNCGTVAPLGTCVLVGTYTVTAADALAGSITNTGTGNSDEVGPETDVVVTDVEGTPALTVDKALTDHNDVDTSGDITEGDILEFTITATNNGNVTLNNVVVSDPMITPDSITCATLLPGDECELVGTYKVQQSDINNGDITNTGTGDSDETPPVTDVVVIVIGSNPDLSIVKTITDNLDEDGSQSVTLGDTLEFTIVATNTGDIDLTNVLVEDDMITPGDTTCATVLVGDTCTLVGTYVIQQSDVDNGQLTNVATAGSTETGQRSDTTDLTIFVGLPPVNPPPARVPSTTAWGQLLMLFMMMGMGLVVVRRYH